MPSIKFLQRWMYFSDKIKIGTHSLLEYHNIFENSRYSCSHNSYMFIKGCTVFHILKNGNSNFIWCKTCNCFGDL